jgi:hypothetical protein
VIVAAARSPIGRANKGHLVDVRPDDLAAYVVSRVLEKVPQIEPAMIDDLLCGCGLPGGEQGFNLGRVVSIPESHRHARVHRQSLLLQLARHHTHGGSRHSRGRRRHLPVRGCRVRLALRQRHVRSANRA